MHRRCWFFGLTSAATCAVYHDADPQYQKPYQVSEPFTVEFFFREKMSRSLRCVEHGCGRRAMGPQSGRAENEKCDARLRYLWCKNKGRLESLIVRKSLEVGGGVSLAVERWEAPNPTAFSATMSRRMSGLPSDIAQAGA